MAGAALGLVPPAMLNFGLMPKACALQQGIPSMRLPAALALPALLMLTPAPALAHGGHGGGGHHGGSWSGATWGGGYGAGPVYWGGSLGGWYGSWQPPYVVDMRSSAPEPEGPPPRDREEWLRECRHRLGDNGLGGAVIGGVVGGVAGNVIAGHGDKVLGTVAGAAVGAVAGAAIDKAEDTARVRDRCEAMLEGGPAYGAYPAGYGYAPYGVMMVPVTMVPMPAGPQGKGECTETVTTTEYVSYAPRRSRHIPPRAPDKRVRVSPDKRVPN